MLAGKSHFRVLALTLTALFALTSFPMASLAQDLSSEEDHVGQNHGSQEGETGLSLAEQLRALQTKVAALEAALKQDHQGPQNPIGMQMDSVGGGRMETGKGMGMTSGMRGMSGMSGMGMGGMKNIPMMGGMSSQGLPEAGGMGMMRGKGTSMMGQMKAMGQMQAPSALPGFAGASHIYHIGATSFFLDHPQHVTLTQDQQVKLNQIKENALLGQATFDRWTSQGEQELWVLTSSDAPRAAEVEGKIREIEKLGGDKRIAYIRAVGEAARVLTDEQRLKLVGMLPPDHTRSSDSQE